MKIYTKTGDDGTTGLFGGGRVPKDDPRVEAYGSVDELNAHIGLLRCESEGRDLDPLLGRLQSALFALGADLATPPGAKASSKIRRIAPEDAAWLEETIDRFDAELPRLQHFILPGGTPAAAAAHAARAVCRRAERAVVKLFSLGQGEGPGAVIFLNRLSDFLFMLGRVLNHRAGVAEEPWIP